jgi:ubiquinone/menaquinone biosynthesis C-methylase UbiE
MAIKNAGMNRLAVELLDIRSEDRVLEIGCGPGRGIEEAARRASRGFVAGIDRSEEMVRQAARRNRSAIAVGRVALRLADVTRLPFDDCSFDRSFEINSFHHWRAPARGLEEIRRVMREGATLLLCLRKEHPTRRRLAAPGYSDGEIARVAALVRDTGFGDVRVEHGEAGRAVACVIGRR